MTMKVDAETGLVRPQIYKEHTRRRPVVPKGTPRVKSEFKDQCDINRIVARIQRTGDQSALNLDRPWSALDTSELPTNYTDALMLTIKVRDQFMLLTAKERQEFHNDPNLWIQDLEQKGRAAAAAKMASEKAAADEAAAEAAYKKKRREAASTPPAEGGKINQ